jgi:hypothetical protein
MGEALERGLTSVEVGAVIHRDNRASHFFADRFEMVLMAEVDSHHVLYGITLDPPGTSENGSTSSQLIESK